MPKKMDSLEPESSSPQQDIMEKKWSKDIYKNLWLSPNSAINHFELLAREYGRDNAVKDVQFKQQREAWIVAVSLLGIREISDREYWLEIVVDEETPDIYCYYLDVIDNRNHRRVLNIEVTEWEEHSGDIMEIIKKKARKAYPEYFQLLIYARKVGEKVDVKKLVREMQKINIPFNEVLILIPRSMDGDHLLIGIDTHTQEVNFVKFNFKKAMDNSKAQVEFVKSLGRGSRKGGVDLGKFFLPIPPYNKLRRNYEREIPTFQ